MNPGYSQCNESLDRAYRQTRTAVAGAGRVTRGGRNLSRAAAQSHYRPDLVVADFDCGSARANGGEPSCRKTLAQSCPRHHYSWNHYDGADRIGDSARARAAFTSGSAIAASALRGATLADECDRLRAVVLAARRRRAHLAPRAKKIRQHQLSFPADADPT